MLAAAIAAIFLAMPVARAADLPPLAPQFHPVPEFSGWYLRGNVGMTNQRVKSLELVPLPAAFANDTLSTPFLNFDSSSFFGLGVGYQFNPWLRADVTGQFRGKAHFQALDFINNSFPEQTFASKSEWVFLANAYVDLGTWWGVTPFVGAGAGFDNIRISNWEDIGVNSDANNFADAGSKWNFAWAVHAGLGYRVNPNLTLELAYHFLSLGDGVTGQVHGWDGTYQGAGDHFNRIYSHDLTLGLRWMFAAPPPEPFYPLVRKG